MKAAKELEENIIKELRNATKAVTQHRKSIAVIGGMGIFEDEDEQSQYGDVLISLDYNHSKSDFIVGVLECRNLLDANSIAKMHVNEESQKDREQSEREDDVSRRPDSELVESNTETDGIGEIDSKQGEDKDDDDEDEDEDEDSDSKAKKDKKKKAKKPAAQTITVDRDDVSKVNAFVRVTLLPDVSMSKRTKTIPRNNNPQFLQRFHFKVAKSELETRRLLVTVWNQQMFGKRTFLGEAMVSLQYESFQNKVPKVYPLHTTDTYSQPTQPATLAYRGELQLRICFTTLLDGLPTHDVDVGIDEDASSVHPGDVGTLVVEIKEATNLLNPYKGLCSAYCECQLLDEEKSEAEVDNPKTEVVKKHNNPRWNARMMFPKQTVEALRRKCLRISVCQSGGKKKLLGGVCLNLSTVVLSPQTTLEAPEDLPRWMDARGDESILWHAITEKPNTWISASLLLRNFIDDEFYAEKPDANDAAQP